MATVCPGLSSRPTICVVHAYASGESVLGSLGLERSAARRTRQELGGGHDRHVRANPAGGSRQHQCIRAHRTGEIDQVLVVWVSTEGLPAGRWIRIIGLVLDEFHVSLDLGCGHDVPNLGRAKTSCSSDSNAVVRRRARRRRLAHSSSSAALGPPGRSAPRRGRWCQEPRRHACPPGPRGFPRVRGASPLPRSGCCVPRRSPVRRSRGRREAPLPPLPIALVGSGSADACRSHHVLVDVQGHLLLGCHHTTIPSRWHSRKTAGALEPSTTFPGEAQIVANLGLSIKVDHQRDE